MFRVFQRCCRYIPFLLVGLTLCFVINTLPAWQLNKQVIAQSLSANQLVQQGLESYQSGKLTEAIALWQQALTQISVAKDTAIIRTNLAQAYQQIGQISSAIAQWEQAIEIYRSQKDDASRHQMAALLAEQAQAYSDLGQHQRAIALAQSAIEIASKHQDRLVVAAAQGALGNAYWALGNYQGALAAYQTSLGITRQLKNPEYMTTSLNNLGNVFTSRAERYRYQANAAKLEGDSQEEARLTQLAQQDITAAENAFKQSVQETQASQRRQEPGSTLAEVRALLNLNRLWQQNFTNADLPKQDLIRNNQSRVLQMLANQPDSREKAYALIGLAASFGRSQEREKLEALQQALAVAKNISDHRAESFVLGSLGQVYESAKQYDEALQLTRQAAFAAQQVNAADSLYRWQWQTGRILKQTDKTQEAISSYNQAIATLQSIRGDIVAINKDVQFNFRDAVEPVYRELIALLLDAPDSVSAGVKAQVAGNTLNQNISKALGISELLKLAELQNFFGDECVQVALDNAKSDATKDINAAVIYSVVLDRRTEIILQLPNGSLTRYPVLMGAEQLQKEIDELRLLLEKRGTEEYLTKAQDVYKLLISPMAADLAAAKPSTLIFVNDGVLRKVPMAALHDGKEFLIQRYAIATTPSLSLTTREPLDRSNLQALIMGLTVERPPFAALLNVDDEATGVQKILEGTKLLDRDFTANRLQTQLQKQSYPIVHMATHGKFGTDAASTFLLTYDSQLTVEQIDSILQARKNREPVELLTLSACQTAAGDNRSALGIAGVAVRAGVKSALASLWFINDESTVPLIQEFYTQLRQPGVTKAEALRRAQIKMIGDRDYGHPAVWSPFILIGNWL
jgi:CHAT domain-containing protein